MKVAIFTEAYTPHINGVVTHIKILKEGLEALGHEVLVVAADSATHKHYIKDGVLHCPAHKLKHRLNGFDASTPVSMTRLHMVSKFNPDIIHVHNEFGVGLSGIAIAKILKVPLVYTLHTMYDDYIYYVAPRPLVGITRKISHQYFKMFAKNANAITGPSVKCEEFLHNAGVKQTVNVIPNSVELDAFSPDKITAQERHDLREKLGVPQDATLACFVGRLGKEKSIDDLINFWHQEIKKEEPFYLMIVGDGPERDALHQQVKELDMEDRIIMTGRIEHPDLPPYLLISDIYVTASLSEMNSISMLEGMAAGLPVLQRLDEKNKNQIHEGENGYLFNTAAEMAALLRNYRNLSPEEREKLQITTRQSVKSSGAENLANYMLAIYHGIAGHKKDKKHFGGFIKL